MSSSSASAEGAGQADIGRNVASSMASDDKKKDDSPLSSSSTTTTLQSWRQRLQVASDQSREIRGSNYVQLATVDPTTHEPRCRCIVFRGFQELPRHHPVANHNNVVGDDDDENNDLSCVMRMTTDLRSQKVRQATVPNNTAELVWWFPASAEQFRIRGELIFVGGSSSSSDNDDDDDDDDDERFPYNKDPELCKARIEQWQRMSDAARESFFQEAVPGQVYQKKDDSASIAPPPVGGKDQKDGTTVLAPPPDNFLLMLLKPNHVDYLQLKDMYRQVDEFRDGKWLSTRVNP